MSPVRGQISGSEGVVVRCRTSDVIELVKSHRERETGDRPDYIPSGTLSAITSRWNACFAPDPDGISSPRISTPEGSYVVVFHHFGGDKSRHLFSVDILNADGMYVVETAQIPQNEVRIGATVDETLVDSLMRRPAAIALLRRRLAAAPPSVKVVLAVLLVSVASVLSSPPARAQIVRFSRGVIEFVKRVVPYGRTLLPTLTSRPTGVAAPVTPTFQMQSGSAAQINHEVGTVGELPSLPLPDSWRRALMPTGATAEPADAPIELSIPAVRRAIHENLVVDPHGNFRNIGAPEEVYHPAFSNILMNVVSADMQGAQLSFSARLELRLWAFNAPSAYKWTFYRIRPDGTLDKYGLGRGKQVFQRFESRFQYAVVLVAESGPDATGLYVETALGQVIEDHGKWVLKIPGQSVESGEAVKADHFEEQVSVGKYWNDVNPRRFVFVAFMGAPTEDHELIAEYDDGTSDDASTMNCGTISGGNPSIDPNYNYYCLFEHSFASSGTHVVRVRVANKRIGTHPNHPNVKVVEKTVKVP